MLWSALTKSLVRVVKEQVKGLEIPGFGVFGPVIEEWSTLRDPMEKGPIRSSPFSLKKADLLRPTVVLLEQDFLDKSNINISNHSNKAVFPYNKDNFKEL